MTISGISITEIVHKLYIAPIKLAAMPCHMLASYLDAI